MIVLASKYVTLALQMLSSYIVTPDPVSVYSHMTRMQCPYTAIKYKHD